MLHLPSANPGGHFCALADDLGELETLASIFLDEGRLLGEQTLSLDAAALGNASPIVMRLLRLLESDVVVGRSG